MIAIVLDTTQALFGVGLLSGGLVLGGILVTLVSSAFRFWSHGARKWKFWVGWTAWTLYVVSIVGVASLDWWQWYEPSGLVQLVCVLVFVAGAVLSIWAMWMLRFWESSGLEGRLQTEGPYQFSRNPQYVGFIAMLASDVPSMVLCSARNTLSRRLCPHIKKCFNETIERLLPGLERVVDSIREDFEASVELQADTITVMNDLHLDGFNTTSPVIYFHVIANVNGRTSSPATTQVQAQHS